MADQIVASQTVIVHDENIGIDRKVIAGQPVPPDLVKAYQAKTGDTTADPGENVGYDSQSVEDLEELARDRGIYDAIEGTGSGGNVVKADLVKALKGSDA